MSSPEKAVSAPPSVSQYDIQYLQRQVDNLYKADVDIKKLIKLLIRILVDKKIVGEELAKTFEESKKIEINPKVIEWYEAKWIQKMGLKKGALHAQLGIKEDEKIPTGLLQSIVKAEIGQKVSFKGKSITVTTQLKRRALIALRLGKINK